MVLSNLTNKVIEVSTMSIETLALISTFRSCRESVISAAEQLEPFCRFAKTNEVDNSVTFSLLLRDDRTIWGEFKQICAPDVLLSATTAKSCLALESGSRRSSTETAILYALPAFLLMSNDCLGVIDPQRTMTPITKMSEWSSIAIEEVQKDAGIGEIEASEIYNRVFTHLTKRCYRPN